MKRHQISMETKHILANLLLISGEYEVKLEKYRQKLCQQKEFEPYASFQRIDRFQKGYITPTDLLNFLK